MNPRVSTWKCFPGSWDTVNATETFPSSNHYGIPDLERTTLPKLPRVVTGWPCVDGDAIHTYTDDYRFERLWRNPARYLDRFAGKIVIGFDFSTFTDWPIAIQIWNVYRNRYLARWYQTRGVRVVPVVSWAARESYDFAFLGIPRGSVVSVTSVGAQSAGAGFVDGCCEMFDRLRPSRVIVIGPELPFGLEELCRKEPLPITHFEADHLQRMKARTQKEH